MFTGVGYMNKILWGPLHNNSRDYLVEKASSYLEQGQEEKFCYLAPTPQLLYDFRERLLENKDLQGTGKLHLYLFDGLFNELLKEGGVYRPVLSELEQEIILRNILNNLKKEGKLEYFAEMVDYEGFYRGLLGFLMESTAQGDYRFLEENFQSWSGGELTGLKEKELGLILKQYYSFLRKKGLTDKLIRYSITFRLLETEETFLNDLELIIIDGFQKLSGVQYRFIQLATERVPEILINISYDENRPGLYGQTIKSFKRLNFKREWLPVVKDNKPLVLQHLEKNLFRMEADRIEADDSLKIFETPTRAMEMKVIARECKRLIFAGVLPEDIGIIIRRPDLYFDLVEGVYREYKLPYSFTAAGLSPLRTPVWKIVNDLHKILEDNLARKGVMNLLKSNLLNLLEPSEYDEAEELINKLQIVGGDDWYRLQGEEGNLALKLFERVQILIELRYSFIKQGSFREYASMLWNFLRDSGLEEGILQEENIQWISRDLKALDILKQILMQGSEVIKESIGTNEFFHWLKRYLEREQIKEKPEKGSKIEIMTPSRARGRNFKYLFISGLLEDEFPSGEKRDWLFSVEEKARLREKGFNLISENDQLLEERFFFYSSLANAEKRLYLSYPSLGAEAGGPLVSSFINEVKKLFYEDSLEIERWTSTVLLPSSLEEALNLKEAREFYLCRGESHRLQNLLPALRAEINRWSNQYSPWDGLLKDQQLIRQITRDYKEGYVFSASELETYANCPFQYFAGRVLKLTEMEEPQERLDALNLGNLYHRILYLYFKEYFPGNWEGDLEEYERGLKEAAGRVFSRFTGAISLPEGLWELYQEEILFNIKEIIRKEWEEKGFTPAFLELGFGLGVNLEEEGGFNYPEPVEIDTPSGVVSFRGKIDRIDLSTDRKKALIWDYKFGDRQGSYKKMVEGFNLQLPLYILISSKLLPLISGLDVEVIGAAYYSITKNKKDGIWKADYEELIPVTSRSKSCLTSDGWEEHLELFRRHLAGYLARILEADFRLKPEDCSNCDFRDICRYETGRIGGLDV
jgi:ATP-dependent helicase/DNAse subunit B